VTAVVVRVADPAQYDAIARVTAAAYEADGQLAGEHGYERVLADVPARARAGELLVALDEATGEVLGSVLFVLPGSPYAELAGPGEAEFRMLAVAPAAQGRGAGEALVRACLTRAVDAGCAGVVICVRSFSAAAHRLYARLGFVRVPELDWSPVSGVELLGLRVDLTRRSAGPSNPAGRPATPPAGQPAVRSDPMPSRIS
jgi:ribosomal protein S18 acetylase RimI-like enzyme